MDVNEELKFLWKIKKKKFFLRGGGESGFGGQGGCERRIEVFVKIQIKNWGGGVRGGGGRVVSVGQGRCNRRIEVFGKIHKKKFGWGGGGGGVGLGVRGWM